MHVHTQMGLHTTSVTLKRPGRPTSIPSKSMAFTNHTTSNDLYVFAEASSLNQARPEELPSGSICNGTRDKKGAMEREKLDLQPGHETLGKLLNLSKCLFQPP